MITRDDIKNPDQLEEVTWQLISNCRGKLADFIANMPEKQRADPDDLPRNLALLTMTLLIIRDMRSSRPRRTDLN